ncbi:WD40-repeat-containing domain protein [Epithele typhae]|uniref:WD40-repeat-containing domain protein n=1 Tax=Epithele typhae TaxID=378194 RepID=UPI0020087848|nr:WD40-repeat-containing domain protein [Epithele typhae]KAH9925664.1 WD40-repeat-containing domain protein [Epithele typhae]
MPQTTILAASLQYGVVSRSDPLSGKILHGYLDASGTLNGLGIGNPNAEFSPHVSAVALASVGGTAKVLWGFRHGEVAVTTASRAMEQNRPSAAKLVRCRPGDSHEGSVQCVAWARGGEGSVFVSGGTDGRVKVWEAKTPLKCLWTTESNSLVPDPCIQVAINVQQGVVVAGLRSGTTLVWTGFSPLVDDNSDVATSDPQEFRLKAPAPSQATPGSSPQDPGTLEFIDVRIAPKGVTTSLLAVYHPTSLFHRFTYDPRSGEFDRVLFGDEASGPIRSVYPVWAAKSGERDFVIAGDQLGNVSIFAWDAAPTPFETAPTSTAQISASVRPFHRIVAHEDGAVTALAWNHIVLVTGSSQGTVKTWDALMFTPLRTFPSPAPRPFAGGEWDSVSQILIDSDTLVVSVGNRVLAWKAGPAGPASRSNGKGKGIRVSSRAQHGVAKWQQQMEMYCDIAESRRELDEERTHVRRSIGRQKEQLSTLAHLGLNEVEALEYVLMLSRDEEEERRRRQSLVFREDEGVFMADFEEASTPMAQPSSTIGSRAPSTASSRTSSFSTSPSSSGGQASAAPIGRSYPRTVPSSSNRKIQISPRVHPEPTEARVSSSPLASRSLSAGSSAGAGGLALPAFDAVHFPSVPVSRTPSSASVSGPSAPGSPRSVRSAWSTPLRSLHSSEAPLPLPINNHGALATRPVAGIDDDDDEDLKFAIELSLAEARSRGEGI